VDGVQDSAFLTSGCLVLCTPYRLEFPVVLYASTARPSSTLTLANLAHNDLDNRAESLHLLLYSATLNTIPEARAVPNVASAACLPRKQLRQALGEVKSMGDRIDRCAQRLAGIVAIGQGVDKGAERSCLRSVFGRRRCDEEENGGCVNGKQYVELSVWVGG